ncbi:XF1762 family protein [Embleya sp. NPDC008237]|uniref:XF1762 family protein n=1 Tax=Embleya sp. NPDC008237 TaxID=3363978 RepID=UPI0036E4556E
MSWSDARALVAQLHRHYRPPPGYKFAIGVADENDTLHGVAIVGRPVARHYNADKYTLEITRVATDGSRNACSMLYGAAWRAASALGYRRLITYTRVDECGASLRGAGWRVIATRPPRGGWNTPSRPRAVTGNEHVARHLWEPAACHHRHDTHGERP